MAIVPVAQQQVGIEAPGFGTPNIAPIGADASGVNVAESAANVGKTAEHVSSQVANQIYRQQKLKEQIDAQDRLLKADTILQDGHAALLDRQGKLASGIVSGSAPVGQNLRSDSLGLSNPQLSEDKAAEKDPSFIKFEDSSAGIIQKAREQLLDGLSPNETKTALSRFDRMAEAYHGRAIRHEVNQTKIAAEDSLNNAIAATQNAGAMAVSPDAFVPLVKDAQEHAEKVAQLQGHDMGDKNTADAVNQKAAHDMMAKFIDSNPQMPPDEQQKMLDAVKPMLNHLDEAKLQKPIDGKWVDYRTTAIQGHLLNDSSGPGGTNAFKDSEGLYDLAKVERYAEDVSKGHVGKHGYAAGEEMHQAKQARDFAVMQNGAIKEARDDAAKGFLDDIARVKEKNPNADYQEVEKAAISKYAGSIQPGALEKLKDASAKTWLGDPDGPQVRLKLMMSNPKMRLGYEDAKALIDQAYKGPTNAERRKLATERLDAVAPKFSDPKQLNDWQADQLSKVNTKGGFHGWFAGPVVRSEEEDKLRGILGSQDNLDAVRSQFFDKNKRQPTYAELDSAAAEFKRKKDAAIAQRLSGQ